ncbi:MAG: hypothetical protein MJZ75_04485 [Paludibacteraceae bacterium]|nr:hypothetical protein [Paludibacteraceae bacterium]
MKKILALVITCVGVVLRVGAVAPMGENSNTHISTAYFGPNAFPIPDMLDGRTCPTLQIEVAGDYYHGFAQDKTADLFLRTRIPLFTPRVNLTIWMPVVEGYWMTLDRQRQCEMQDTMAVTGHGAGDVYVSTDIQLLQGRRWWPDIAVRAAFKTASGGQYYLRRHFDDPGYWCDLSVGKGFMVKNVELRLAVDWGFLCWQTTTGCQNDAWLYGVTAQMDAPHIRARVCFSGYKGWETCGGDKPMSIKAELRGKIKGCEPFIGYQYGIQDYPFHQLRVGFAYQVDILKNTKRN